MHPAENKTEKNSKHSGQKPSESQNRKSNYSGMYSCCVLIDPLPVRELSFVLHHAHMTSGKPFVFNNTLQPHTAGTEWESKGLGKRELGNCLCIVSVLCSIELTLLGTWDMEQEEKLENL